MGRCFLKKTRRRPHGLNWECLAESYFGYCGRETDSGWVGVTVKGSPLASPLNSELLGHRCPAGRTPELGAGRMVLYQEPEGACPFLPLPLPPLHTPLSEYPWRWQLAKVLSAPGRGRWLGRGAHGRMMCLQLGVRWACKQEGSRLWFSGLLFLNTVPF